MKLPKTTLLPVFAFFIFLFPATDLFAQTASAPQTAELTQIFQVTVFGSQKNVKATFKRKDSVVIEANFVDEADGTSPVRTTLFSGVKSKQELESKVNALLIDTYTKKYVADQDTAIANTRKRLTSRNTADEIVKAADVNAARNKEAYEASKKKNETAIVTPYSRRRAAPTTIVPSTKTEVTK